MANTPEKSAGPERFEELLKELEGIVKELETGRLTLEESLERYQRGVQGLKRCYEILDSAEKRIEVLTRDDQGNIVFTSLDPSTASPEGTGRKGRGAERKPPSGKGDDV